MQPKGRGCATARTAGDICKAMQTPTLAQQHPPGEHPLPHGDWCCSGAALCPQGQLCSHILGAHIWLHHQSCSETATPAIELKRKNTKPQTTKHHPILPFQKVALALLCSPRSDITYLTGAQPGSFLAPLLRQQDAAGGRRWQPVVQQCHRSRLLRHGNQTSTRSRLGCSV